MKKDNQIHTLKKLENLTLQALPDIEQVAPTETGVSLSFLRVETQIGAKQALGDAYKIAPFTSQRKPLDFVAINNPGNSLIMTTFQVLAPAIVTGYNPENIHIRFTSKAPRSSSIMEETIKKIFPDVNINYSEGKNFLDEMISKPGRGAIFVYGSDAWALQPNILSYFKNSDHRIILELNGKNPFFVFDKPYDAGRETVYASLVNSGQACQAVSRCYVTKENENDYLKGILDTIRLLDGQKAFGHPDENSTYVGTLMGNPQKQIARISALVSDALNKGAKLAYGSMNSEIAHELVCIDDKNFALIHPLVLKGCNHDMRVMTEELFAPIIPIQTINNHQSALSLAQDSPYGLSASIWMDNKSRKDVELQKALSYLFGKVYVNGSPVSSQYHALHAMGGYKNSRVIINPGDEGPVKMSWEKLYNPFQHTSPSNTDTLGRHGPSHTYIDITTEK